MEMVRLDKFLTQALAITRSQAKELLSKGRVVVDGVVCKKGDTKVSPAQEVTVNGKGVTAAAEYVYLMLNKPEGIVSASRDPRDKTVVDLVAEQFPRRELFPAGRLDKTSTGFVLITDDGAFAHEILHPKHHVPKTYVVGIDTPLTAEMIQGFETGVILADGQTMEPASVKALSEDGFLVRVQLRQGVYHQIKRMFGVYGVGVNTLHREDIGGIALDKNLAPGEWRQLTEREVQIIRKAAQKKMP